MKPMPQPTGIREKFKEIVFEYTSPRAGYTSFDNENWVNKTTSKILSLISDELKWIMKYTWEEKYKDENMEYSEEKELFDKLGSNLISAGLMEK